MAINRYRNTTIVINHNEEYKDIISRRGMNSIVHFSFDQFKEIKVRDVPELHFYKHIWTSSDRFFKLAYAFYGDAGYWWIIAYFNNAPLETDLSVGDTVLIPTPLEVLLSAMEI
jgi:hypothetical protein